MAILMFPPEMGVAITSTTLVVLSRKCLEERVVLLPGMIARAGRKLGKVAPRFPHPSAIPAKELRSLDALTNVPFGLNRLAYLKHHMFNPGGNESSFAWIG